MLTRAHRWSHTSIKNLEEKPRPIAILMLETTYFFVFDVKEMWNFVREEQAWTQSELQGNVRSKDSGTWVFEFFSNISGCCRITRTTAPATRWRKALFGLVALLVSFTLPACPSCLCICSSPVTWEMCVADIKLHSQAKTQLSFMDSAGGLGYSYARSRNMAHTLSLRGVNLVLISNGSNHTKVSCTVNYICLPGGCHSSLETSYVSDACACDSRG